MNTSWAIVACEFLLAPHSRRSTENVKRKASALPRSGLDGRAKLDLGEYVYAVQCLHDVQHARHLLWTWIKEGRPETAQRSAGWSGLLSLPKECHLDPDGNLVMKAAAELASLRREGRSIEERRFTAVSENPFAGFEGDCFELEAELLFDEPLSPVRLFRELKKRGCGTKCCLLTFNTGGEPALEEAAVQMALERAVEGIASRWVSMQSAS